MTRPSEIFEQYLAAFTRGEGETAAGLLADDFEFHGPMVQTSNKAAFLESTAGLAPITRGYTMKKQFGDGDEVCSIYDFEIETPKGRGSIAMTEWSRIADGKLVSSRLIFDTAAFARLMPE